MKALLAGLLALACGAVAPGSEGFTDVVPGYRFTFPRDHGSHPSFRTEWW